MDTSRLTQVAYYYREKTVEDEHGDKITILDGVKKHFHFEPKLSTVKDFINSNYPTDVEYLNLGVRTRVAQNIQTDMTVEYKGIKYKVEQKTEDYGQGYSIIKAKRNIPNTGVI